MINNEKRENFVRRWAFLLAENMHKTKPIIDETYVFGVLKTALPMILDKYEAELRLQFKREGKVA